MSENPVCSKCGKEGVTLSLSVGESHESTPPICLKCFRNATLTLKSTAERGLKMLTVSGKCMCHRCESRTTNQYRMVGHCTNCGQDNILMLFRAGDEAHNLTCPTCGSQGYGTFGGVHPDRLATQDEIPEA